MNLENIKWMKEGAIDLLVESYSSSALVLQVRGINDNEMIIGDHTTSSDRSLVTSIIAVTAMPRMLTVRTASTSVKRGTCYVRISLRIEGVVVALLFADYVTDGACPAFPNGNIISSTEGPGLLRIIAGTDPAAGVDISETVPTNALWKILQFRCVLTTDANVANRQTRFIASANGGTVMDVVSTVLQTASQIVSHNFVDGGVTQTAGSLGRTYGIGNNLFLPETGIISTVTINMQAGDDYSSNFLTVEEWIQS